MYDERIEQLISAALADGVLTEKEKQVLFKRAQEQGIDLDEFEIVLDARLVELQKAEQEKREKSAPKSDKYGDVRKCPACGAIVGAFKGICPECGYEFSNVDANLSSKKLHELLSKESSNSKKAEIIETFPIPNTKADLLEFLTALKPRALDVSSEFANAYFKKYSECIEKAKVSYEDDKQLLVYVNGFGDLVNEFNNKTIAYKRNLRKAAFRNHLKKWWKLHLVILIILGAILIPIIENIASDIKEKKSIKYANNQAELFEDYLADNDIDRAKGVLKDLHVKLEDRTLDHDVDYIHSRLSNDLLKYYIENMGLDAAIDLYDNTNYLDASSNDLIEPCIHKGYYKNAIKYSHIGDGIQYAEKYYKFMTDVVVYLCGKGEKSAARKFINEYCTWFVKNVDPEKDYSGISKWVKEDYKTYNSQTSKAKLLKVVAEY